MALTKQLFSLFFLFLPVLFFPLRHASNPPKCSSSFSGSYFNRCGRFGVPIRFPFCGHAGFNLHCDNLNKTVLELPMSGTFLVDRIEYSKQQISIKDPEYCLAKRLLTFNTSGSPFSYGFSVYYTFLTCPNEVLLPSWSPSIPCLSNSTSSFFATSNLSLANSMLPSCQIVKRLAVPLGVVFKDALDREKGFSGMINYLNLLLEWSSPNCRGCEEESMRCGFKNKAFLEVKCFADKPGHLSTRLQVLIITLCAIVGFTIFATCIVIRIYNSERFAVQRRQNAAISARTIRQQPSGVVITTGLDQSTIESYKKVEVGESRRLPGTNGIICPICLSEYASKEIVRCIPECDHCFHVECIDAWLKIHGSCPVCRNSRS